MALGNSVDLASIKVNLTANYLPPAATIRVQAFTTASLNDVPVAQKSVSGVSAMPLTVTLEGLEANKPHYVVAYIDQNNNNYRDIWESWGYYRKGAAITGTWYLQPQPLYPAYAPQSPVADVRILHVDSDQDMIADAYEYANNGGLLAGASDQSWLGIMGLVDGVYTDLNNDGVNDYEEFFYGTDPTRRDTSGDGISDRQAIDLGLSPTQAHSLRITAMDSAAAELGWAWDIQANSTPVTRMGMYERPAREAGVPQRLNAAVTYVLERTDSLKDPQWESVKEISTDETSGSYNFSDDINNAGRPAGFYRIRAVLR